MGDWRLITRYYADVLPTSRDVRRVTSVDDPDEGPPQLPACEGECQYIGTEFTWAAPSDTCKPTWPVGATGIVWVETAALEDLKAAKNAEINAARLKANRTSFQYGGKAIACDELSMIDIQSANGSVAITGALPGGWPGAWKAMDNTYVPIPDVATWTAFYQAMVDTGTANFNHSQDLKAQLAAATTPEQVAAIVW